MFSEPLGGAVAPLLAPLYPPMIGGQMKWKSVSRLEKPQVS